MELEPAIKKAISIEQEAHELYVDLSKRSGKPELARFFLKLAFEELRHKRLLEMFLESGDFQQAWADAYNEHVLHTLLDPKDPYHQYNHEELKSAWKLAIKKEIETYEMYKGLEEEAATEQQKKLFDQLKRWEKSHRLTLEKEYKKAYSAG